MWTYSSAPAFRGVACTGQAVGLREVVDAQERVTQVVEWLLMFNSPQQVSVRDKLIYTDQVGSHTIFVETMKDNAGRAGAFTVTGQERV